MAKGLMAGAGTQQELKLEESIEVSPAPGASDVLLSPADDSDSFTSVQEDEDAGESGEGGDEEGWPGCGVALVTLLHLLLAEGRALLVLWWALLCLLAPACRASGGGAWCGPAGLWCGGEGDVGAAEDRSAAPLVAMGLVHAWLLVALTTWLCCWLQAPSAADFRRGGYARFCLGLRSSAAHGCMAQCAVLATLLAAVVAWLWRDCGGCAAPPSAAVSAGLLCAYALRALRDEPADTVAVDLEAAAFGAAHFCAGPLWLHGTGGVLRRLGGAIAQGLPREGLVRQGGYRLDNLARKPGEVATDLNESKELLSGRPSSLRSAYPYTIVPSQAAAQGGWAVGEACQVYSKSGGVWCDATVEAVDGGVGTVQLRYHTATGKEMLKMLALGSADVRRRRPSGGLSTPTPRGETSGRRVVFSDGKSPGGRLLPS